MELVTQGSESPPDQLPILGTGKQIGVMSSTEDEFPLLVLSIRAFVPNCQWLAVPDAAARGGRELIICLLAWWAVWQKHWAWEHLFSATALLWTFSCGAAAIYGLAVVAQWSLLRRGWADSCFYYPPQNFTRCFGEPGPPIDCQNSI